MSKKQKSLKYKYSSLKYILIPAVVVASGVGGYFFGSNSDNKYKDPSGNTAGYVLAEQAKGQVNNFYRQYIERYSEPQRLSTYIRVYGSNNLVFYNTYYQHGFDPITCSSLRPVGVTVTRAAPGTVATVYADLTYSDHSTSTIKATVLINNDGIKIDSITCPGSKGNLPPQV